LKEFFRQCSKGTVEEVESVEKAETRQPKGANNKSRQKANCFGKAQWETKLRYCILANGLPQFEVSERTTGDNAIRLTSAAPLNHLVEGMLYGIQRVRFYAQSRGAE
jgi:hypothetical protein